MNISIQKSSPSGTVKAPASKSESHRLLICAGLSGGRSVIKNVAFSEDIKATLRCVEAVGGKIQIDGNTVTIDGINSFDFAAKKELDCGESGSTLRFFIPICLLSGKKIRLTGSGKLLSRPLDVYKSICEKQGIEFDASESGIELDGKLKPDTFEVDGNISSQFISGLLFALPLLEKDSIIKINPPFESRPYVDMTIEAMGRFGVDAHYVDGNTIYVSGNQCYNPCNVTVGGDWSNAAFFYAFKESGAELEITGTDELSTQGDRICVEYFRQIKEGFCTLDLADCPDLAPILFAFAAIHGGARFRNTRRLRFKESDRISCMQTELKKFGVETLVYDNEVVITESRIRTPDEAIYGHNDHRIVMAMAYMLTFTGGRIEGCEAVRKSFPDFFEILEKAGVILTYETR